MRYALVGYGRMGRAIDAAAAARGHRRALVVDRGARGRGTVRSVESALWKGVDVAFEFTEGEGAAERVLALLADAAARRELGAAGVANAPTYDDRAYARASAATILVQKRWLK